MYGYNPCMKMYKHKLILINYSIKLRPCSVPVVRLFSCFIWCLIVVVYLSDFMMMSYLVVVHFKELSRRPLMTLNKSVKHFYLLKESKVNHIFYYYVTVFFFLILWLALVKLFAMKTHPLNVLTPFQTRIVPLLQFTHLGMETTIMVENLTVFYL